MLPKSLILFFVFNGIIKTILVAFSMKTSRACTGMLCSENDDFEFLKTGKNIQITCSIVPGLMEVFYSPNRSVFDQKHERKNSNKAVLYIFQNVEI